MFSTHLALLACLCAALPLAVPAGAAAHVQPGHSISPDSRQRTHDGSVYGSHRYDGRHDGHQALPPLLRRYDQHHRKNDDHNHGTLDDAHHKTLRSPFARSRYHRQPANFGRRYSVYFPGENGDMYMVSRAPTTDGDHGGAGAGKRSSHAHVERQDDESSQVLGRIDIMVDTIWHGNAQRVASLTIDSTPIDWTSGQSSAEAFQLNASTTNQTQFVMLPAQDPSDAAGNTDKHVLVTLATEVFNPSNAEMVMYCATYDPDPGTKSALVMMPCDAQSATQLGSTDPCANDGDDAPTPNLHKSQLFTYDPTTGQVAPIATSPSSSATRRSEDDSIACAGARVRRNGRPPPTTSNTAKPSNALTGTKFTSGTSGQARNVTLVYVATALQVPASSWNASSNANTTKASPDQAEDSTTTVTTTKTVTVTVSLSSSGQTATPARAATSPTTTTGPLMNAKESLQVEIIGITDPAVTSSSSMTTTMTTKTRSTSLSSGSSARPSLDSRAAASMIADSRGHRRVR